MALACNADVQWEGEQTPDFIGLAVQGWLDAWTNGWAPPCGD